MYPGAHMESKEKNNPHRPRAACDHRHHPQTLSVGLGKQEKVLGANLMEVLMNYETI